MFKKYVGWTITAALVLSVGIAAGAVTADEILDRMDEESDKLAEGSIVAVIEFHNEFGDGTTNDYRFGSLSKPGYSLIYFLEPIDVRGSVFLTHETDEEDQGNRLFLYLPYFGSQPPKELVSDEERGGSFAQSSLSYEDVGDQAHREEHDASLIGEEDLVVGDETRTAYVIESIAKEGAENDTPRTVLWVDVEAFLMLKMEAYNDLGNLGSTMEVLRLGEFEGRLTADKLLATDVSEGDSTTIAFVDRHRPESEIPDEVFSPESLSTFDPAIWGF